MFKKVREFVVMLISLSLSIFLVSQYNFGDNKVLAISRVLELNNLVTSLRSGSRKKFEQRVRGIKDVLVHDGKLKRSRK